MNVKTTTRLLLLAACLASSAALADRSLEASIETGSALVQLPSDTLGTVMVRGCDACASQALHLSAASRFEFNSQPITLAELRRLFAAGQYSVLVTTKPGTADLSRIVITGVAQ